MSNWRIKSTFYGPTDERHVVQKRLLGFLWWYNPDNFDGYTTGVYDTYEEAMAMYDAKRFIVTSTYTTLGEENE